MRRITLTIDGMEVSGSPGTTILDVAKESGVAIPTLCHDVNLSPYGDCQLCLVEEEPTNELLRSCAALIRSGMVINTQSPRVRERRKAVLELMLASHGDSCAECDQGNRCQLRKIAADMGMDHVKFHTIAQRDTKEDVNAFIQRDLSKCIRCAKCIRADQELVVEGAIDYVARGFIARPATLVDVPQDKSECTLCGSCLAICPVGALTEKMNSYAGRADTAVETTCGFCGCGCGIRLETRDNHVVRATPAEHSPVNRGALCVRGSYGYGFIHSPERLTHPLIQTETGFQEIAWDEALTRAASEFQRIGAAYGPDSLSVFGSSKCTNEENYALQRLARAVMGTNNIDNGGRLSASVSLIGLGRTIGFPGSTSSLDEVEKSDVILLIGANPVACAPAVGYAIKRAVRFGAARLILIDPRETKLATFARVWLRPKVGTDLALLAAIAGVIVDEGLYDLEFVERCTDNFDEMVKLSGRFKNGSAAGVTGVPAADIELAARIFGKAERASIVFGDGICRQIGGADCVSALANLAMLTGSIGRRGGGLFALKPEANAQGACDMGALPDFLPGYRSVEDSHARSGFEERWGVSLPASSGTTALEMTEPENIGKIRAMLIVGENPVAALPEPSAVRRALSSLDFLVVTDMFLTETAKLATLVLPAASFAEKEGTFTNFEGRVRPLRKVVSSPGESLTDLEVILRLAAHMGKKMPYSSPGEVMDEIREMIPSYSGPTDSAQEASYSDFEPKGGFSGTGRLHGGIFPTGFSRFCPPEWKMPASDAASPEYPLTLLTGAILPRFGAGTRTARVPLLKDLSPRPWIEIGQSDAERFGVSAGDKVKVISPDGQVTTTVAITHTLPEGTAFMPMSFPESPVNELLHVVVDTDTKMASVGRCVVRLEKIGNSL